MKKGVPHMLHEQDDVGFDAEEAMFFMRKGSELCRLGNKVE
jgi:hypothetical protein